MASTEQEIEGFFQHRFKGIDGWLVFASILAPFEANIWKELR